MKRQLTPLKFPLNSLTVAITAAFLSQPLAAQSNVSDIDPEEVDTLVVIGQATSGLDNLITKEELDQLQATDLNGIFRNDPAVTVGGPVSMGQKVYVRDLGEDLLNISVDGAEQAAGIFHHAGRVSVEPELLKQVEVAAGAGSATAGPGALGGSVRFTTKDPDDLLEEGKNIGALLKGTYSSNGGYFKKSATVFARSEHDTLSGIINLVDSDKGNLEDGDGAELAGSESHNKLGFAKLVFKLNEEHKLSVSHENLEESGDIVYKPEWHAFGSNGVGYSERNRKTSILNYSYQPSNNELIDLSLNLYNTNIEDARANPVWGPESYSGGIKSKGATLENTSIVDNHKLIYGFNFRDDKSTYYNDDVTETGRVWGLYVQDVINVNDQLTVTTGLRYDAYKYTDLHKVTFKDNGFSPNISANYDVTDNLSFSAGYAKATKAPTVQDSFIISDSRYSHDENLSASKATNIELGVNYDIENYSFSAGLYQTKIADYIDGLTPWDKTISNLDEPLKTKGVFARAEYQSANLTLGASIKTSSTKQAGNTVTRYVFSSGAVSTGDALQLDARYQINQNLQLGWNMQHVNAINSINITLGGEDLTLDKKAYTVHDIYAQWKPTGKYNLKVNFSINNLFNETYLSHSSVEDFTSNSGYGSIVGYNEAGRDARITLSYQF